jgi:hypothetical protein
MAWNETEERIAKADDGSIAKLRRKTHAKAFQDVSRQIKIMANIKPIMTTKEI